MNIFVGNLAFKTTEANLRKLFEEYGEVEQCTIIMDREHNRSKGFGFVVMPDRFHALEAIKAMNGIDLDGRKLNVNESKPRPREEGGRRHARR